VAQVTPGGQRRFKLEAVREALAAEGANFRMPEPLEPRELPTFAFAQKSLKIAPGQLNRLQAYQRVVDGEEESSLPGSYYSRPGSAIVGARYREAVPA